MGRDIETVIAILKRTYPSIAVQQLPVTHPGADDDGLWFFRHPAMNAEVQLESPTGAAPFLVESDNASASTARTAQEAAEMVAARLGLQDSPPTPPLNASHR